MFFGSVAALDRIGNMVMKIRVIHDLCQGHTLCSQSAPSLFQLREEDGHAVVIHEIVPTELEVQATRAALGCPERAIIIE